jgi:hypothetical protein
MRPAVLPGMFDSAPTSLTNAEQARQERDRVLAQLEQQAGQQFMAKACAFVLAYLEQHGDTSGELLTSALVEAGIVPVKGDTRAYGAIYRALSQRGQITCVGFVNRVKGNLTAGGRLWRRARVVSQGE